MDIPIAIEQCQNILNPVVIRTIIDIESSRNQFALAAVTDKFIINNTLKLSDAIEQIDRLEKLGISYSAGLMQINDKNFNSFGLDKYSVFEPCTNIYVGAQIFKNCYERSKKKFGNNSALNNLRNAASCYFSGNFKTGYYLPKGESYVQRFDRFLRKNISY